MSNCSEAIIFIKNLKGKFKGLSFEAAISKLRGAENGLADEDIRSLLNILCDEQTTNSIGAGFRDILFCCVPHQLLSNDVIDVVILWLLYEYRKESLIPTKINAVLTWISGLVEYGLVNKGHVDGYYELYYGILDREQCQQSVCKLLHMLTRPEDIFRGRVDQILRVHQKNGGKRHTARLLELFKTFKPELVPESVKTYGNEAAFGDFPPGFVRSLEAAAERIRAPEQLLEKSKSLKWTSSSFSKSKSAIPLIPTAMYIHLGSELYREKSRKVIDFLDKQSLASYHLTCEIPTSILSLLLNEGGVHFLVTHNSEVHARFSAVLYSCLHTVFLLSKKRVTYKEKECFLEQLVALEEYMQQGIPVVSRFLAIYIGSWNGQEHQKLIYKLLERLTLSSFEEFNDCILIYIQSLFLSGDVNEKILIIQTLSRLIYNILVASNKDLPKEQLFLGEVYEWRVDLSVTLPQLTDVVINFCQLGLLLTENDSSVLHASLSFFETLADLESEANLELTVLPPAIFYRSVFSLDFSALVRACSLLMRYRELSLNSNGPPSTANVSLLNKYSCDVWNCLLNKKALTKSNQGLILNKPDQIKEVISADLDALFSIEYHPTMIGLAKHFEDLTTEPDTEPQNLRMGLNISFPELGCYLDALERKYTEYHSS